MHWKEALETIPAEKRYLYRIDGETLIDPDGRPVREAKDRIAELDEKIKALLEEKATLEPAVKPEEKKVAKSEAKPENAIL